MLKKRIIPILTFNGFALVKTKQFGNNPRMVGNPMQAARVYNSRGVDELVFVDIFATSKKRDLNLKIVKDVINQCYMPTAIGGNVTTMEDIHKLLEIGADKVVIKTYAMKNPGFLTQASHTFGEQAITVAVDVVNLDGEYKIHVPHRPEHHQLSMDEFIQSCDQSGAGEFVITSVDRDGLMNGFDVDLYAQAQSLTQKPIIASGGGGEPAHFVELMQGCSVDAMAAASIFHFTRYTPLDIKLALHDAGFAVRVPPHQSDISS